MQQNLLEIIESSSLELEVMLSVEAKSYQEKQKQACRIGELLEAKTNKKFFHSNEAGAAFLLWKSGNIIFEEFAAIAEMQWQHDQLNGRNRLEKTPFNFPNAYGVYLTQETIEIQLPSSTRTKLHIRLAQVPVGGWRFSTEYKMPLSGGSSGISMRSMAYKVREDALITAGQELKRVIDGQWSLDPGNRRTISRALSDFTDCRAPQLELF